MWLFCEFVFKSHVKIKFICLLMIKKGFYGKKQQLKTIESKIIFHCRTYMLYYPEKQYITLILAS